MEMTDTLTNIFRHNLWANLRLFKVCETLNNEQLDTSLPGTYGSIRDTLEHILRAERSYLSRISTGELYPHPKDAPPMTIPEMTEAIQETSEGLLEWAGKVGAIDTVRLEWEGTPRDVPKTTILTQVINHATEHRAQIMVIMTQLGVEPPDVSSWMYFDKQMSE